MNSSSQADRTSELAQKIRESFRSGSDAVVHFGLDVDTEGLLELRGLLSLDELQRAARYRVPAVGHRFIACRSRLRMLLGALLGICPGEVRFVLGLWNKPYVAPEHNSKLFFNVSHSGNRAVVAISGGNAIGVDLEVGSMVQSRDVLAADIFCEEQAKQWRQLADGQRRSSIVRAWRSASPGPAHRLRRDRGPAKRG